MKGVIPVQSKYRYHDDDHLIECNLFSTWYSWQIAHFALANTHTFKCNLAKLEQHKEEFEDTKVVIRIHKLKEDRQHNGQNIVLILNVCELCQESMVSSFQTKAVFCVKQYIWLYYEFSFHWFFNPECQHIFGKQTGYIFQSPKTIKTWTTKHYASLNQWYNTE